MSPETLPHFNSTSFVFIMVCLFYYYLIINRKYESATRTDNNELETEA